MHTHDNGSPPSMDQMIFKIGLSVKTISVYLLCCGLSDSGRPVTSRNLMDVWNGSEEELAHGLKNLEGRNILLKIISDRKENSVYKLLDVKEWHPVDPS